MGMRGRTRPVPRARVSIVNPSQRQHAGQFDAIAAICSTPAGAQLALPAPPSTSTLERAGPFLSGSDGRELSCTASFPEAIRINQLPCAEDVRLDNAVCESGPGATSERPGMGGIAGGPLCHAPDSALLFP